MVAADLAHGLGEKADYAWRFETFGGPLEPAKAATALRSVARSPRPGGKFEGTEITRADWFVIGPSVRAAILIMPTLGAPASLSARGVGL